MERNLNNEDFEEFLRQKTDHYKLYPSDHVWKGIYKSLHTRKRWFRIGGGLLFLSALLFINYQFPANRITPASVVKPVEVKHAPVAEPSNQALQQVLIASSFVKSSVPGRKKWEPVNDFQPAGKSAGSYQQHLPEIINTQKPVSVRTGKKGVRIAAGQSGPVAAGEEVNLQTSTLQHTDIIGEIDQQQGKIKEINWLQEMAAIKLAPGKKKRFNLQFYFSPTISYRKLNDGNKTGNLRNLPLASNHLGVNYFVDHKPSVGVEIGSNILFTPTKNLTLKTGLQFNYSRYNIKAYKFYYEKANIALTTVGRVADTVSSYTSIRNLNGYSPEALQNQYVQISLPVGAELVLISGKRLQLNVAGTIQPTYLLYNDTYLLSTDFINYIKEPSLVRKWNLHTSAEAFISYNIGGMRWQVGPQFRYQTLSSYNDRYPIKEYLIEYGVKFGVSKTIK